MKKILFDFFPVILFFVAFKMYDDPKEGVMVATGVAIAASFVQLAYSWMRFRKIERMHLITFALIAVLGGLTLALDDERFIKWKPTAVNWLFALVFLGSHFIGSKPLVQRLMQEAVELPDTVWRGLSWAWIIFFIVVGIINLAVVYTVDTATWVDFKLFGMLGLTIVFVIGQTLFLVRYINDPEEETSDAERPATEEDRGG
jgi:intracellular septation protein